MSPRIVAALYPMPFSMPFENMARITSTLYRMCSPKPDIPGRGSPSYHLPTPCALL